MIGNRLIYPTPRTDEVLKQARSFAGLVDANFARRLEVERYHMERALKWIAANSTDAAYVRAKATEALAWAPAAQPAEDQPLAEVDPSPALRGILVAVGAIALVAIGAAFGILLASC